jgi:pilus assembly protein CpaB
VRSRLLMIILAAVLALAGAVAILAYARQANERAIAGLTTVKVIAAKGTVSARTSLAEAEQRGLLTTETLPEKSVPPEAIRSTAGLAGFVFSATVQPAQLVLRPMLVPAAQSTSTDVLPIPKGMQAITVEMCVAESLTGYITAGSDVSVYATSPTSIKVSLQRTCQTNHNAVPPTYSSTVLVLPKVLVLSVQQAPASASSVSSVVADPVNSASTQLTTGAVAVTFAVHPGTEADQLIEATEVELPYLALIPPTH